MYDIVCQEEKQAYGECTVAEKLGKLRISQTAIINFREIAALKRLKLEILRNVKASTILQVYARTAGIEPAWTEWHDPDQKYNLSNH